MSTTSKAIELGAAGATVHCEQGETGILTATRAKETPGTMSQAQSSTNNNKGVGTSPDFNDNNSTLNKGPNQECKISTRLRPHSPNDYEEATYTNKQIQQQQNTGEFNNESSFYYLLPRRRLQRSDKTPCSSCCCYVISRQKSSALSRRRHRTAGWPPASALARLLLWLLLAHELADSMGPLLRRRPADCQKSHYDSMSNRETCLLQTITKTSSENSIAFTTTPPLSSQWPIVRFASATTTNDNKNNNNKNHTHQAAEQRNVESSEAPSDLEPAPINKQPNTNTTSLSFMKNQAKQNSNNKRKVNQTNHLNHSIVVCNSKCNCIIIIHHQNHTTNEQITTNENKERVKAINESLGSFNEDFSNWNDDSNGTSLEELASFLKEKQSSSLKTTHKTSSSINNDTHDDTQFPVQQQKQARFQQQREQQMNDSMIQLLNLSPPLTSNNRHLHFHRQMLHQHKPKSHEEQLPYGNLNEPQAQTQLSSSNSIISDTNYHSIQIESLVQLSHLNLSGQLNETSKQLNSSSFQLGHFSSNLTQQLASWIQEIEQNEIESLSLAHNSLEFELWAELYALLVLHARPHLYKLDLSHNELVKLGVAFTGYMEHHLIQNSNSSEWPFSSFSSMHPFPSSLATNQSSSSSIGATGNANKYTSAGTNLISQFPGLFVQNSQSQLTKQTKTYTLTSGGKLFSQVQLLLLSNSNQPANSTTTTTSNLNETTTTTTSTTTIPMPALSSPFQTGPNANANFIMQIKALDLSHNSLKWLINDQFRALKHVQSIRLERNRIRFMHQHAFTGLESLRYLNLAHNKLQLIYMEQFQTNYNLQALNLRDNGIAYLRAGSFAALRKLKRLDLAQNKLTILSNNAFIGLESLELLNCSGNQFVHAPSAALHPLTSLRQLDLSYNLMAQLAPGTFFHLPLEELRLERNEQLVAIDRGAFWDLPQLSLLKMRSCTMLMRVNPQAFVASPRVQFVDVTDCPMLESEARRMLENLASSSLSLQAQAAGASNETTSHNKTDHSAANSSMSTTTTSAQLPVEGDQQQRTSSKYQVKSSDATHNMALDSQIINEVSASRREISELNVGPTNNFSSEPIPRAPIPAAAADDMSHILELANNRLKYAYYATSLAFLIVALKLILKYTNNGSRNLLRVSSLRRRRRVYETSAGSGLDSNPEPDGEELASVSSYELRDQTPGTSGFLLKRASRGTSIEVGPASSDVPDVADQRQEAEGMEDSVGNEILDQGCDIIINDELNCLGESGGSQSHEKPDACATALTSESPCGERDQESCSEIEQQQGSLGEKTCDQMGNCDGLMLEQHEQQEALPGDRSNCDLPTNNQDEPAPTTPCSCCQCSQGFGFVGQGENPASYPALDSYSETNDMNTNFEHANEATSLNCETCINQQNHLQQVDGGTRTSGSQLERDQSGQTPSEDPEAAALKELLHHHSQQLGLGSAYEFDHANCNHFYQSIGPALQFADIVNQLDHANDYYQ